MPPAQFIPKTECAGPDDRGYWTHGFMHDGVVIRCYRVSPLLVGEFADLKKYNPGQMVDMSLAMNTGPKFLKMSKKEIDEMYDEMEREQLNDSLD